MPRLEKLKMLIVIHDNEVEVGFGEHVEHGGDASGPEERVSFGGVEAAKVRGFDELCAA